MNRSLFIEPMNIQQLLDKNFFIPAYQRGYRWAPQQVKDFLNDINQFEPKINDKGEKSWYCLQPLVLKPMDTESVAINGLDTEKIWYEVIDGQQRLTTIFLVVHYINEMWKGKSKHKEFTLKYQTRQSSSNFLNFLEVDATNNDVIINDQNIDFFFISTAYQAIHKWAENLKNCEELNEDEFGSKIIHYTKVIWYETESDSVEVFTRLNVGKIPLTNAELIKALFLNKTNFIELDDKDKAKIRLQQIEISTEWDRMEYALQNDSFWYFLTDKKVLTTRIDLIFNLISKKTIHHDEFFTFRFFSEKLKKDKIKDIWGEVKQCFQTLEEWYQDRKLYHKIGYLIAIGYSINEIYELKNSKSKMEFLKLVNNKILEYFPDDDLSELQYGFEKIRHILLFHNVQTLLNNQNETTRFPFDRYKKEKWDVEHITALADQPPRSDQHKKDWIKEILDNSSNLNLDSQLQNKLLEVQSDLSQFDEFFIQFMESFQDQCLDVNSIDNLVLLDSSTNRSYKNSVFPIKRRKIIEREKNGTFVPICTKNVFMKFYSTDVEQMSFWGEKDREQYLTDIEETINSLKQS
ncbi:DUF262 domain-containing protein [Acinetobacter sp. WCHAc060025]|uniref:DUF262 domain-containing protein n=1 Tax=Acinetobacter sp. WCHAc060025 TaxID=2518625 RepID=UPI0010236EF0|nr:DUF262 domain-containing protein [Acinetobacter sp. WCHAc060025]RZG77802.1 DUF262 domain-containing protein [Acinetobacter sp. WCHAc060025]